MENLIELVKLATALLCWLQLQSSSCPKREGLTTTKTRNRAASF